MDGLPSVLVLLVAAWAAIGILVVAVAVARDARAHGQTALGWGACALLLPVFGALAYLVQRRASSGGAAIPGRATHAEGAAAPSPMVPPILSGESPPPRPPAPAPGPAGARPPNGAALPRRPLGWLLGVLLALAVVVCGLVIGLAIGHGALPPLGRAAPTATPSPRPSPTLSPATPAPTAAAPSPVPTAAGEPVYHIVAEGDTLGDIALQYETTIEALLQANGLDNPDHIMVGQRLVIARP